MRSRNDADHATQLEHSALRAQLTALNLPFMCEHYQAMAQTAADKHWSHLDYLSELASSEASAREDRRVKRRIKDARFPVLKTLDQFDWNWPTSIDRPLIEQAMTLDFIEESRNLILLGANGPIDARWRRPWRKTR